MKIRDLRLALEFSNDRYPIVIDQVSITASDGNTALLHHVMPAWFNEEPLVVSRKQVVEFCELYGRHPDWDVWIDKTDEGVYLRAETIRKGTLAPFEVQQRAVPNMYNRMPEIIRQMQEAVPTTKTFPRLDWELVAHVQRQIKKHVEQWGGELMWSRIPDHDIVWMTYGHATGQSFALIAGLKY